jgi:oligopeptide transport system substrate-binding protein
VARRWEISDDGRRYLFRLRDDVYRSDGEQVTAMDFQTSWLRSLDPAVGAPDSKAALLYDIKDARAYRKGDLSDPQQVGVQAIDARTLEVELERPASYFLQVLWSLYPVPAHVVAAYGDNWTDPGHIVTNGPFRVELGRNHPYCDIASHRGNEYLD